MRETIYNGKSYPEPDRETQRAVAAGGINLFRYYPKDRLVIVAEVTMEKFSCKRFYPDMPQSFADEMVCDYDRPAFFKMYQAIGAGEKKATAVFRMKDGITYVRGILSVLEADENGTPETVVGMAEDVTAEIVRERESKNKEQALYEHQIILTGINRALSSNYNNVYLVDLEDGSAKSYDISDEIRKEYGNLFDRGSYSSLLPIYVKNSVYPPDQELFDPISDLEKLRASLSERESQTFNYRIVRDDKIQHFRCRVVKMEIGKKEYCVLAFRDINAEVIRELEQKAQLRAALAKSEQYKNAVLAEAITVYEVNLTRNVIKDEIWEAIDGKHFELLSLVGLSAPAGYDEFLERWTDQRIAPEYKELYKKEAGRAHLLKQFEEGHTEFSTELLVTMGDGGEIYVRHTIFLAQDEETGDVIAYCNVKNITDQKLKELQMRQYEQLFVITAANIYSGILQVEIETRVTNRIMFRDGKITVKKAGYWEEYLEDQLPYVHSGDRESIAEALNIHTFRHIPVNEKRVFSYKSNTKNKADRYKSFFTTIYMTEIDGRKYGIIITIDNTNTVERELRQKKLIEDALARAEAANKAKTTFLSNMSHDIRTPMNAVIGFTSLATAHIDNKEQVRDYLGKIMSASNHLLSLINDILDMSRIESGRMQLEETECSLTGILHDLRSIMQADIKAKGLHFYIDAVDVSCEYVMCDKLRLNQVLLNILGNAVKFTEPGGNVSVRVRQRPGCSKGYGMYEFHLKDTGIGMSEDFQRHIFEPFERERTSTISGIQGTGLGMAITKNIVELMGGTIEVKSQKGKGTEFIIVLPMKALAGKQAQIQAMEGSLLGSGNADAEKRPERKHGAGQRVLLVEDIDLNREIAREILTAAGFLMEEAENGKIALDRLLEKKAGYYDLVLMDIQMPVMDGYSASRAIRALEDKELAKIPIIAMTADAFEEDRKKALEAGMNAHVAKPIEVDKLFETLDKILD